MCENQIKTRNSSDFCRKSFLFTRIKRKGIRETKGKERLKNFGRGEEINI
jgi:hypothetical protein